MSKQEGPRFRIEGNNNSQATGWVYIDDVTTLEVAEGAVDALGAFESRKVHGDGWDFRALDRMYGTYYRWRTGEDGEVSACWEREE